MHKQSFSTNGSIFNPDISDYFEFDDIFINQYMDTTGNQSVIYTRPVNRRIIGKGSLASRRFKGKGKINNPSIRRLARRGGVQRLSKTVYPAINNALTGFLQKIIKDSIAYASSSGRKTVSTSDVLYALKLSGRHLYGFDN